jgi:hypothetical protein
MVYILCMPYADPTQQRHAQREWWKSEYQGSPTFRRKELRRKKAARAAWTSKRKAQNREYMREFMRAYRAKLKKKEKAKAAKPAARVAKNSKVKRPTTKARAPRRAASARGASRRRG